MTNSTGTLWRSRWAAIGAAIAVTLGAGGLISVNAASPQSVFVAVSPTRVLDTRIDVGLTDAFEDGAARTLDVTGTVPVVLTGNVPGTGTPVPDGATAIVANVTAVAPTTAGFVSVRPGDATGEPTTSNLNFTTPGAVVPNSVTVELAADGTINLFFRGTAATATTDLLVDIVGYYVEGGAGTPGPKGDTGDPGVKGDTGDAGPRGFSAWDTVPSGVTVTGAFVHDVGADADNEDYWFSISYPARLPANPTSVNFAGTSVVTTDDDPSCTGSVSTPTAPPGQVCLYLNQSSGIDGLNGQALSIAPDEAFVVQFNSTIAAGDLNVWFTWAYTAP